MQLLIDSSCMLLNIERFLRTSWKLLSRHLGHEYFRSLRILCVHDETESLHLWVVWLNAYAKERFVKLDFFSQVLFPFLCTFDSYELMIGVHGGLVSCMRFKLIYAVLLWLDSAQSLDLFVDLSELTVDACFLWSRVIGSWVIPSEGRQIVTRHL